MAGAAELATRLVQAAPAVERDVLDALRGALDADGGALARAIARVVEGVAAGQIDAGIALPAIAMACATLDDPRAGEREREVARFEIDTLLPVPRVDVPVSAVGRRPGSGSGR